MTESQWLTETTLEPLLAYIRQQPVTPQTQSRSLHFAAGCYRQVWDQLDSAMQTLAAQFERAAKTDFGRQTSRSIVEMLFSALSGNLGSIIGQTIRSSGNMVWIAADFAVTASRERGLATEIQADLLRDIVGNPFRPVIFDPVWQTESVRSLVDAIHDHKRLEMFPILGDTLLEAGCREAAVTDHCHQSGCHYDGCWVIQGLLESSKAESGHGIG